MIGEQITGTVVCVTIQAVVHEGLTASHQGQPAQIAIVDMNGKIVAIGKEVAKEALAVAINCHRNFLKRQGHLRVLSAPIPVQKQAVA